MSAQAHLKIDAEWLRDPARARVFAALAARGYPARAVGGAIRNTILGLPVEDVDVATPATPEEVMEAATAAGLKALPTGLAHGTITVVVDGKPTEVTTLRHDVETHGRHATVAFTRDWGEDASRRDFTINALYCDPDGTVHDPLGGYADVIARRVRFIGDPVTRIREDYLRILRFFRFNARYGRGPLDPHGLVACVTERAGLARLSGERVQQELQRLLLAPRALEMMETLHDHGLLVLVLGRAPRLSRLRRLLARQACLGAPADASQRLAALAVAVAEDAQFLRERLRLANRMARRLEIMAGAPHWRAPPEDAAARALIYRHGAPDVQDWIITAWSALHDAGDKHGWQHAYALAQTWTPPAFPLSGSDALQAGVAPGPAVGEKLRAVEAAWIASDFTLQRDDLLALLQRVAHAPDAANPQRRTTST